MKGATLRWGTVAALVCAMNGSAFGDPNVSDRDRIFRQFTREAATVGDGHLRLEVRGMTMNDTNDTELNIVGLPIIEQAQKLGTEIDRVNGGVLDLLGSYGIGAKGEVGFDIPFIIQSVHPVEGGTINEQDVGDTLLYGKVKHQVADHCSIAAGVEFSLPTGPEHKFFGTGEFGSNPFAATRYQNGRFAIGLMAGYQLYTGNATDFLNYGGEIILRVNEMWAIRAELAGRHFNEHAKVYNDIVVLPGIDFNLTDSITIRPTGLANITDDAIDWGLGLGLAWSM